jgi:hypothetical protein
VREVVVQEEGHLQTHDQEIPLHRISAHALAVVKRDIRVRNALKIHATGAEKQDIGNQIARKARAGEREHKFLSTSIIPLCEDKHSLTVILFSAHRIKVLCFAFWLAQHCKES